WELAYNGLAAGEDDRHFVLIREEFIDRPARPVTIGKAVIVKNDESAGPKSRKEKFAAILDAVIKIHIDVGEGEALGLDPLKGVWDPAFPIIDEWGCTYQALHRHQGSVGKISHLVSIFYCVRPKHSLEGVQDTKFPARGHALDFLPKQQ